jgi:dephospho-CoA kinase
MTPKVVGLTGGMASGKSYVRSIFEDLNVPCIDCDHIARDIHQNPNHPALNELSQAFPLAITSDGRLDVSVMRDVLGSDVTANARLQAILTPYVIAYLTNWTHQQDAPYVLWESAILIESNAVVDRLVVVDVEPDIQMTRIRARNPNWSDAQIKTMLGLQMSRELRLQKATDVIYNNKTVSNTRGQIFDLYHMLNDLWGNDE